MKKIIAFFLLLGSVTCSAQENTAPAPLTKSDYLAKAKRQKGAGWALLVSGFLFNVAGLSVHEEGIASQPNTLNDLFNTFPQAPKSVGPLLVIGTASMLGSIPLFIASSRNRRTAATMTASFKIEEADLPFTTKGLAKSFPAITLKLAL